MAASLEAFRERVHGGLAQASFEQRRQLVLLLIDRVVVTDADVEIRYVLPTSPDSEHVRFCQLRKDYFDHPPVPSELGAALDPTPRDPGLDAAAGQRAAAAAVIVALVGMKLGRALARSAPALPNGRHRIDHLFQHAAVVDVGSGQRESERDTVRIREDVAFGARLAPVGGVWPCVRAPLLAATDALSSAARLKSMAFCRPNRSSSMRWRRSHTPARCQSRNLRQQVIPEPQPISWGSNSQGVPERSTNKMPVSAARSGRRGRPPLGLGGSGGMRGSITAQRRSDTRGWLMPLQTRQPRFR
jgi:hypothetical protein